MVLMGPNPRPNAEWTRRVRARTDGAGGELLSALHASGDGTSNLSTGNAPNLLSLVPMLDSGAQVGLHDIRDSFLLCDHAFRGGDGTSSARARDRDTGDAPEVLSVGGQEPLGRPRCRLVRCAEYVYVEHDGTMREFCCRRHANEHFASETNQQCKRVGCGKPCYVGLGTGRVYDFCGNTCRRLHMSSPQAGVPDPADLLVKTEWGGGSHIESYGPIVHAVPVVHQAEPAHSGRHVDLHGRTPSEPSFEDWCERDAARRAM